MEESHLDLAKAKFSTSDDLTDIDLSRGSGSHTLNDGSIVSVDEESGGYVVKDSSGNRLNAYEVSASDTFAGGRVCWLCYTPADGPYTCIRVRCGTITVDPA